MKCIIDGNKACSKIAYFMSEVLSNYPITPSSPMASEANNLIVKNKKNLYNETPLLMEMQSEAGAAGAMHGALISGSLASTFTASQGLLLMIPNMYKMAGEMLPGVIHVASRTVATHALSIFGDHSDIYATEKTGFCMLASNNVEEANHLAAVAHLSAIKGSLPFLHFFDGFRTSHEINVADLLSDEDILKLIDYDSLKKFKENTLNSDSKIQKGLAFNEDVYFQTMEAKNLDYLKIPDIVNYYMEKINEIKNTNYMPFNYYGASDAENIIIAMGSVIDTCKIVVDSLNKKGKKTGVISVHLLRPFSKDYLLKVLPNTVKNIAVLDRTKESGSVGEPLYLDVLSTLKDKNVNIVGGRYGLSSKDTTPDDIAAIYKMLDEKLKNNFTISIVDDLTNLSLEKEKIDIDLNCDEIKIYGFGSDGMVSASKDILQILYDNNKLYVEGYFSYDSKKSGGVTVSHLRYGKEKILAPYYVMNPKLIVVTKDAYFSKFKMIDNIKENGILLVNTNKNLNDILTNHDKKIILDRNIKVFKTDADKVSNLYNIPGKINKIMETIILTLLNVKEASFLVLNNLKVVLKNKGSEIIDNNVKAVEKALESLEEEEIVIGEDILSKPATNIFDMINNRMGDTLTVNDVKSLKNGSVIYDLSKYEKRDIADVVPSWNSEKCIECGICSLVCPHAVIRPILNKDEKLKKDSITKKGYKYQIVISERDCTSCGLCILSCPTKALEKKKKDYENDYLVEKYFDNYENEELFPRFTIKGSQLRKPCFSFSGACQGCGETPYIKLLTQLFQQELMIANATGCSSIYGGSLPETPYSINWANSLFEDNAEFAMGMLLSDKEKKEKIKSIINTSMNSVNKNVRELYDAYLENIDDYKITKEVKEKLKDEEIPSDLKDYLPYMPHRSIWAIGGDGWAYDIGFSGIDHVLSSGEDINILVLDTEVYSNTGGQASKSSRLGQVAEFANLGKETRKKDLFKIALCYPNCYVAEVSLGADYNQTIKAFKEAHDHKGPSIIICYSPCVEHGIKNGMINSISEEKKAVKCGYTMLMRYLPSEEKLYIDSKEPDFTEYIDFLSNERRFKTLMEKDKTRAEALLNEQVNDAKRRYSYYKKLSED